MANITGNLLHGHINFTHTSTMTPYYLPGNVPTPWPVAVVSLLISLTISCYGGKGAFSALSAVSTGMSRVRDHPKSPWARKRESAIHETELEDLHKPKPFDAPPPYNSGPRNSEYAGSEMMSTATIEEEHETPEEFQNVPAASTQTWDERPRRKILEIIIFIFSTFRSVVAFIINLQWLVSKQTPLSAPSILLLLLVSIQVMIANVSIPRIMRMILTADALLVTISFCIAGFAPLGIQLPNQYYPAYGNLAITGGNCPVYASNCFSQTTHWEMVGCGNYTQLVDVEDNDGDAPAPRGSFVPYASSGDLNTKMNPLHIIETVIIVFGGIWLFSVLFQIYEVRYLISPRKEGRANQFRKKRCQCGTPCMGIITMFGVMGAFVATFMSIGGHLGQAVGSHHSVYLDSFGPAVWVNGTWTSDNYGDDIVKGAQYWGNATSWSDCFVLTAPTSADGFWSEWVQANKGSLYRIAAGV